MAKKEEVKVPPTSEHHEKPGYFPVFSILIGVVCIALALVLYWNLYSLPSLVVEITLLVAGVVILKLGFQTGFEYKRKAILKKYL